MDVARENIVTGRITFDALGQSRYEGVIAREQTGGRGQRGREWYSAPGESLCATYYFRRGLTDPQHAGQISLLAGVAVAHALQGIGIAANLPLAPSQTPSENAPAAETCSEQPFGLKWPNDVLLHGKKVGGILIEMVKALDEEWVALIGVGINISVRRFPDELVGRATSLELEGITAWDWRTLGKRIASALREQAYYRRAEGFAAILSLWRTYDQTPGRRYQAQVEGATVEGTAVGIDDTGLLRLQLADGREVVVGSASSLREL
jgi:BirA family biotin operon repressor/biotin-[acetyl-CoA-carboxylase] ligase